MFFYIFFIYYLIMRGPRIVPRPAARFVAIVMSVAWRCQQLQTASIEGGVIDASSLAFVAPNPEEYDLWRGDAFL